VVIRNSAEIERFSNLLEDARTTKEYQYSSKLTLPDLFLTYMVREVYPQKKCKGIAMSMRDFCNKSHFIH